MSCGGCSSDRRAAISPGRHGCARGQILGHEDRGGNAEADDRLTAAILLMVGVMELRLPAIRCVGELHDLDDVARPHHAVHDGDQVAQLAVKLLAVGATTSRWAALEAVAQDLADRLDDLAGLLGQHGEPLGLGGGQLVEGRRHRAGSRSAERAGVCGERLPAVGSFGSSLIPKATAIRWEAPRRQLR